MILQPESFSKYKAIVLDFDGVLVDSNYIKSDTFYDIWPNEIKDINSVVDSVLSGPGDRYSYIKEIHKILSISKNLEGDPSLYIKKYTESVKDIILKSGLKPDVPAFFNAYQDKLLLINSMTPEEPLKEVVDKLHISPPIKEAKGLPETKIEIFHYFMEKYNFKKNEMIFVGDSESDFEFARQMEIDFFGILSKGGTLKSVEGNPNLPSQ